LRRGGGETRTSSVVFAAACFSNPGTALAGDVVARARRSGGVREHEDARRGAPARHRDGGEGRTFLNKGTNGRWKDVLTPDDITSYRTRAAQELPPALNAWLENGRRGGDPKAMAD